MRTYDFTKKVSFHLQILDTPVKRLKVYKLKSNDSVLGKSIITGFCRYKDIPNLQQGITHHAKYWELFKPSVLKIWQKWGWAGEDGKYDCYFEGRYKDNFEAIKQGRGVLIKIKNDCHMAYDMNGQVLPIAICFDYISACMNNGSYDLLKAKEILTKRNDIHFLEDGVVSIPYYNASKNRNKYLTFLWRPSVDDYKHMWEICKRLNPKHPYNSDHQAIFQEDLLGLRAGGAAKFNTLYVYEEPDDDY